MWFFKKKKKDIDKPEVIKPPKMDLSKYKYNINIKSICYYEKIAGKSFTDFSLEDITQFIYACFIINNPEVNITYSTFLLLIENRSIAEWLMIKNQEALQMIQQFNEATDEGDEVQGEKITNTITDYATSLIIDYGLDAHYVMYEMKLWEIPLFFEAVSTKMMRDMEQKRFWTYLNIMPHIDTKKCKSPEALLPFKWEKGKRQERAEQNLKNNLYAVKHTIGKSIFGDKDKKENG